MSTSIKKDVLLRISSAVESICTTSSPTIQVGEVVAQGSKFCSPYVSRHEVSFSVAENPLPSGAIRASSWKHELAIGMAKPTPVPHGHYVGEWVGGPVPTFLVEPVYQLARELGLPVSVTQAPLTQAWVLRPALAGWHYGRPVFLLAGEGNAPAALEGEPAYQQGALLVGWNGDDFLVAPKWYAWAGRPIVWFFNHAVAHGVGRDAVLQSVPAEGTAVAVAVLYHGTPHVAVRVSGPVQIVARDHEDLTIPEGEWVALHPFPRRGDED